MSDRIPVLQEALASVEKALKALTDKADLTAVALRRVKRVTVLTVAGLILDFTLTLAVGWGWNTVHANQVRLNDLAASVQLESDRNKTAECAMVALFLQFEPKTLANPGYTPEQHTQQIQAYETLRQIARDLQCP